MRVDEAHLDWPGLEAVACWGARRGPAILVNVRGTHSRGKSGRRSTLAHELCHLLVDRARALPLAEVLGGRAPLEAEQRANAFAAELVLPRAVAGAALRGADVKSSVASLERAYGASAQIIAWQAIRSGHPLSKAVVAHLRALVPRKDQASFDLAAERR
ncbi:MAG TPA: ImmA/IrrE family metallo-endopeptidase [Polyangiaceae bacterium]|nr:ImmA/IrrE family metallo-endopeptidase [Polyangiaceae bacterium]